jgi:hypothetical protein
VKAGLEMDDDDLREIRAAYMRGVVFVPRCRDGMRIWCDDSGRYARQAQVGGLLIELIDQSLSSLSTEWMRAKVTDWLLI